MRLIFCWLSLFCATLTAKPLHLDVNARHAILMNADTGAILYEKNARVPAYPASTTKVATALFALDRKNLNLNQLVTVSAEAVRMKTAKNRNEAPSYWLESDGSTIGLLRGETLGLEALFHGLLLRSGNDAANVIAETVSGSVPTFMDELNAYLAQIGCLNTHFCNPHGYHHPEHQTTAYDLCMMTRKALKIPAFREIVSKESYLRPKTNKRAEAELKQSNRLVVKESAHYYPKSIGVKTGYHSLAGEVLVSAAEYEGRTLISVTMGAPKRKESFAIARSLFEAAFAEQPVQRLLVPASQGYTKSFEGAKTDLTAILVQDFCVTYYPAEEPDLKAFVYWEDLSLPLKKGAKVGELRAFDQNEQLIAKCDLYARDPVEKTFFFALKDSILKFIR
jgi:D-alanyl-D-alanine carboxypeptidase (penicillin-binding protein 5/6)